MGPRPRRLWRRVVKWFLISFGLIVLLIGAAFGLLHTDFGRDKVRGILVAQLDKRLNGTVEVARLEGDILDAVTLRGLVVRDESGKQVLKADALTVDYRVLPLLDSHFHADLISIDGLEAELRRLPDGRLAVADLWIQTPPSDSPPWSVTLDSVTLRRSAVKVEGAPGVWDEFKRLELDAGLKVEPESTQVTLGNFEAEWKNRQLALDARADLLIPKNGDMVITNVEAGAGKNHIVVPRVTVGPQARSAMFVAEVSAPELKRLWPESPVLADATLAGFVTQDLTTGKLSGHVFGGAGDAAISAWAELGVDASSGEMGLFWAGVAPHELVEGAPDGRLDGWLTGKVEGLSSSSPPALAAVKGSMRGGVAGQMRGAAISRVAIDAELAQRRLRGQVSARARFGSVSAKLSALLPAELNMEKPGQIAIEGADVVADVRDVRELQVALGQPPDARGPVSVKAHITGRLDDLTVKAKVTSARLSQKDLRLTGLRADLGVRHFDPRKLPEGAVGTAEIHLASIVKGDSNYGNAHVIATLSDGGRRADVRFNSGGKDGIGARGALSARIEPGGARVKFRELRIATRKLVWQGKGGKLEVTGGGRKISADLALSSKAGALRVTAGLTRRGKDMRGPVRFRITNLDIGRVMAELGKKDVRGVVSGNGELQLPSGPGKVQVEAKKVSWPGAIQPISGKLSATLARRKLDAKADIDAGPLGRATAVVAMRTPAVLTDAAGWKRLRAGAVQSLTVDASKIDLARLAHAAGGDSASKLRSGLAELKLEAGPALETGRMTLVVKGGEVAASTELVIPLDITLEAALSRAQLTATGKVIAGDHGKLDLDAAVAVPGQPLDAASWKRRGLDLIQSVRVRLTDFNLDRLQAMGGKQGASRSLELTGAVQAEVTAGQGARSMSAKITFRNLRGVKLAAPLSGEFTATAEARRTDLALAVRLPSGPLLGGKLQISIGADDVRGLDFDRLSRQIGATTLKGDLTIPEQPVARIASAVDATPAVSGRLSGKLDVAGTVDKPVLGVQIDAPGFTAQGIRFERLQARARYQAGPWQASIDARQSDGGRVALQASGGKDNRAPLKVHLTARKLRLGLFTPLWKRPGGMLTYLEGMMSADLDISGTTEQPIIDGGIYIREGEARIAQFLRPITEIKLDLKFNKSRAALTMRARARPGRIQLTGAADLRRLSQASFTSRLVATKLPVQSGKQLVSINGNVRASGRSRGPMMDIDIEIERGIVVELPSQKGLELHESGPLEDVEYVDAAGAAQAAAAEEIKKAAGPAMRIKIRSEDLISVRSDELRLDLKINLTSTKIGEATAVEGNIEGVRGWIEIVGQRYNVERAEIRFGGEIPPNPTLDIRVGHQFPDQMVYIDVSGTLSKPEVSFASDSGNNDQGQLLGIVLGGGGDAGGGDASTTDRAGSAAAGLIANQVGGYLRKSGLPVDVLRFESDPDAGGEGGLSAVTVGKWLSERLFVAFRYRPTAQQDENQSEGTFQHFFTRDWMWEGVVGARENSIDLLWIVPIGR